MADAEPTNTVGQLEPPGLPQLTGATDTRGSAPSRASHSIPGDASVFHLS